LNAIKKLTIQDQEITGRQMKGRANGGQQVVSFPLTCTATSTFTGTQALSPGTYDVWVTAIQAKETNVGFARTTLVVT
jgi:hypothetical protein